MNEQLTKLECAVMEKMLAVESPELEILRKQFSTVALLTREMTETDFFTRFDVPAVAPRLEEIRGVTIVDVSADAPELKNGAGFVLFIENGAMNCLEGFCCDESWPDSISTFELSYLKESPRGSGKLVSSEKRDFEFALKDLAV